MQSEFQFDAQMSLYIPHVFPNFTAEYITGVFQFMEFGNVDHVDLVAKLDKNGNAYNAAYIHFAYWYSGPVSENFQARVKNPKKEARIIHDDPWYWIVLENTATKHVPGTRKICIDLAPGLPADANDEDDCAELLEKLRIATTHEEEISILTEKLFNQNRSLLQTEEQLCAAQEHNCKIEAELEEAHQEIIDKELELQAEVILLDTIIQKVLRASTLEEAKKDIYIELGCSYK